VWETPRPLFSASWSTPAILTRQRQSTILVLGSKQFAAYDASKGAQLWSVDGFPGETAPSIALGEGLIFAGAAGMGGRSNPPFEGVKWSDLIKLDQNHDGKLQKSEIPNDYKFVLRPELPESQPGRNFPVPLVAIFDGLDKDKNGELTEEEWNSAMASFSSMDTPFVMALRAEATAANEPARIPSTHTLGLLDGP